MEGAIEPDTAPGASWRMRARFRGHHARAASAIVPRPPSGTRPALQNPARFRCPGPEATSPGYVRGFGLAAVRHAAPLVEHQRDLGQVVRWCRRYDGTRSAAWPRATGLDRRGDQQGGENPGRNGMQRENGARRALVVTYLAAAPGQRASGRGGRGGSDKLGRIAIQREDGARRSRAVRPHTASACRHEPTQAARGKSQNPGRIAIQRETDTERTTGQGGHRAAPTLAHTAPSAITPA
jgi:hypothetical protein